MSQQTDSTPKKGRPRKEYEIGDMKELNFDYEKPKESKPSEK